MGRKKKAEGEDSFLRYYIFWGHNIKTGKALTEEELDEELKKIKARTL